MDTLLELYWKSSLLIAAGGVAALLARRTSAATRHLIWTASLLGALAMPLAGRLLPRVTVATLPAEPQAAVVFEAPRAVPEARSFTVQPMPVPAPYTAPRPHKDWLRLARAVDWAYLLRLLWIYVAGALLVRIVLGQLQLRRIARRARPALDQEWLTLLRRCGAAENVSLLISRDVKMPITWGTLHPRIVIPENASDWNVEHRRAVLLHELAHVERRDSLTQLIARIACAFHWLNPLAWLAAAAMRNERERACDDRVLAEGARPTDYASSLLEVARSVDRGNSALAMARRGQLEGRLLAVLDPTVNRRPAGRVRTAAVALAAALVAIPLAAVRAERVAAAKSTHAQVSPPSPPSPPSPSSPSSPASPAGLHGNYHIESSDGTSEWSSSWSDGHKSTHIIAHGKLQWNDDMSDLSSLSRDGSFDMTVRDGPHGWHAEIFADGAELKRTFIVDGATQPWDARWFASMLDDLDRHSGFAAEARFPKLYAAGGAKSVLERVNAMDGDYGRSRYLQLLVSRDPLDEPTAKEIFGAVAKMSGDYERSQILKAAAAKAHLDTDAKRAAFFGAARELKGNYERSQVMRQLIDQQKLSPDLTHELLAFIAKMDGDYEKSQLLTELLKHPVDAMEFLKAVNVSGSYEHSRVLKGLIAVRKLDGPAQIEVIRQARDLGDYESAQVLVSLSESMKLTDDARRDYERLAEKLGEYSRKRVLAALDK
jgi:beta-lactamase regulating signal transducer with metallopeptidase domain